MPAPTPVQSTTQQFLDIYDVTNDLLIMKDGATALILQVSAINFGLFAEEEQDAVIYAYAGLLNSLNYPIQIVIRSQTKDVTAYLHLLQQQEEETLNQEKRDRIRRYREFVSDLIHEGNVLDKKFYVVIPANALEMGMLPPQTVIPGVKKTDVSTVERSVILEKAKNVLEPKADHLVNQFARIGLVARQLKTQEIIQLFYASYNPEAAEGQQITDTKSYTTTVVSAQIQSSGFPTPTGAVAPSVDPAADLNNAATSATMASTTSVPTTDWKGSIMTDQPLTPPVAGAPTPAQPGMPATSPIPGNDPLAAPASAPLSAPTPPAPPEPATPPAAPVPTATITPPTPGSMPTSTASAPAAPVAPAAVQSEIDSVLKQMNVSPASIASGSSAGAPMATAAGAPPASSGGGVDSMPPVAEI